MKNYIHMQLQLIDCNYMRNSKNKQHKNCYDYSGLFSLLPVRIPLSLKTKQIRQP